MSFSRTVINTTRAAQAIGPYNQAVLARGSMLFVSGQIGLDPESGKMVEGGVEAQCHRALKNMGEILKEAGADYSNVVKTTVLLTDMNDFPKINDIYAQYFTKDFPARACFQVSRLPKDGSVEIEAVAVVDSK